MHKKLDSTEKYLQNKPQTKRVACEQQWLLSAT